MKDSSPDRPPPFPWRRAMAVGFGRLGLSAEEFWRMTPRELAAALEGIFGEGGVPLDRTALGRLIERFPDRIP